jgi:hypothetical protein
LRLSPDIVFGRTVQAAGRLDDRTFAPDGYFWGVEKNIISRT